jgi:group II intron reverse transcriptase/maturase
MSETPSSRSVLTKLERVAELARRYPGRALTTLAHHIDVDLLREAYRVTRKDGAVGIDGQTAEEYAKDLGANLRSLLDRLKTGSYWAPAVRRVHIPKRDGRSTRPIGVPTFEDKVLQRAVAMVVGAVYEQGFLPCSYGFRPGRSAHQALRDLWQGVMAMGGGWVVDVDIQDFFGSLDHHHLRSFLDQRVRDGVLRRAIDKWLKAGVLEEGQLHRPEEGTPQGGVISPLLANIYLHVVLDEWFEGVVRARLRGRAVLIRYGDDFVVLCAREDDAKRVFAVLPKRLGKYGLLVHPGKTRLVRFRPNPAGKLERGGRPGTFDFLGFTHYWGRSRRGQWIVRRKTASDRQRRALREVGLWLKRHRHSSIATQHEALSRKLRGHFAYYGITGNARRLGGFRFFTMRLWQKWLNRRSQRRRMTWERFNVLLKRYPLPYPVITHSAFRRAASP